MHRHHDMGGLPAETVEASEHDYAVWEKRVDSIVRLLSKPDRKLLSTDELRRAIEELGPGVYDDLNYYERWISAATNILLEKGVLTVDELGRKMHEVDTRWRSDRGDET